MRVVYYLFFFFKTIVGMANVAMIIGIRTVDIITTEQINVILLFLHSTLNTSFLHSFNISIVILLVAI